MGDSFKIHKQNWRRSSSSIVGSNNIDGCYSERNFTFQGSQTEMDDHFAAAEKKCEELNEHLEKTKKLRKKKKSKKLSLTGINLPLETQPTRSMAFGDEHRKNLLPIKNRTKKPLVPRLGLREGPLQSLTRGTSQMLYANSIDIRQQLMINKARNGSQEEKKIFREQKKLKERHGDNALINAVKDEPFGEENDQPYVGQTNEPEYTQVSKMKHKAKKLHDNNAYVGDVKVNEGYRVAKDFSNELTNQRSVVEIFHEKNRRNHPWNYGNGRRQTISGSRQQELAENETRHSSAKIVKKKSNKGKNDNFYSTDQVFDKNSCITKDKQPTRLSSRNKVHGYEKPTVCSTIRQSYGYYLRNCFDNKCTTLPFVTSKSTAPSHNLSVNIQQVLNGLKVQQPIVNIPPTIAHHMGLRHEDYLPNPPPMESLPTDEHKMNVIKLGNREVRLPSYKFLSYNRLLSMYRTGNNVVSRFLRTYGNMANRQYYHVAASLSADQLLNRDKMSNEQITEETKQKIMEYTSLFKDYEKLSHCKEEGNLDAKGELKLNALHMELAQREDYIKSVLAKTTKGAVEEGLRASASAAPAALVYSSPSGDR